MLILVGVYMALNWVIVITMLVHGLKKNYRDWQKKKIKKKKKLDEDYEFKKWKKRRQLDKK